MLKFKFERLAAYRVVLYLRMSTNEQNPRSPQQQLDTIKAMIAREKLPWTIVKVYRDDGVSGRYINKRPGFKKMIRDFQSGEVKAHLIIVDTFERLTRAEGSLELRNKLQRQGILVVTADSNFADPTSLAGKALAWVESFRSEEDGRVKAHNVCRGKRDAAQLKHWPGGPVPFGYRLETTFRTHKGMEEIDYRTLVPDATTAWIMQKQYQIAFENGWGSTRVAQALNADPDIPEKYKPFRASTVADQLENPIYMGELLYNANCTDIVGDVRVVQANPEEEWIRVPEFCKPLVDVAVWKAIEALRSERSRRHQQAREERETGLGLPCAPGVALKFLLSGLVRCAHCGRCMTVSSTRYTKVSGEEQSYSSYGCPGYPSGACSNDKHIPEPWLRKTVIGLLRDRLFGFK